MKRGNRKFYGRFNQGVVTIKSCGRRACPQSGDVDKFWKIFDETAGSVLPCAYDAGMNRLKGTVSDVAPILWQHGALARLKKG